MTHDTILLFALAQGLRVAEVEVEGGIQKGDQDAGDTAVSLPTLRYTQTLVPSGPSVLNPAAWQRWQESTTPNPSARR
ncbi:MAG: hypothetical protein IPM39_19915 [Chloroflexi bacterium]|nr:hypothetical protein [Chloroflexota bacterium]